mmetsp:Transcript_1586/g.4292  ORF Transcript_1586/g.4292 Transcript_1586/m.4292 type:complete len:321 (-) Transcript_1586:188-1150(-)
MPAREATRRQRGARARSSPRSARRRGALAPASWTVPGAPTASATPEARRSATRPQAAAPSSPSMAPPEALPAAPRSPGSKMAATCTPMTQRRSRPRCWCRPPGARTAPATAAPAACGCAPKAAANASLSAPPPSPQLASVVEVVAMGGVERTAAAAPAARPAASATAAAATGASHGPPETACRGAPTKNPDAAERGAAAAPRLWSTPRGKCPVWAPRAVGTRCRRDASGLASPLPGWMAAAMRPRCRGRQWKAARAMAWPRRTVPCGTPAPARCSGRTSAGARLPARSRGRGSSPPATAARGKRGLPLQRPPAPMPAAHT